MSEPKAPFVRRVVIENYKSIKHCDVSLGPLTFLVGPNGSGKSNFLDALHFVGDCLQYHLENALENRDGFGQVSHQQQRDPKAFSIRLWMALPNNREAEYSLRIAADPESEFRVGREECIVRHGDTIEAHYCVRDGNVEHATFQPLPPASANRVYLAMAGGFPEFSRLHDLIRRMRFYSINPEEIRRKAILGKMQILRRDGGGCANVFHRTWTKSAETKTRIDQYMHAMLPTLDPILLDSLERHASGELLEEPREADAPTSPQHLFLTFPLRVQGKPVYFPHQRMSDGTLRAFGVLLALFQCRAWPEDRPIPLVGIEEPESTLHPAAAGVLFDALHEASYFTQVVVSTHSAELLDIKDLDPESLVVVEAPDGETIIGPADEASLSIMRDRLFTAGELLEMDQLRAERQSPAQPITDSADDASPLAPDRQ